MLPEGQPAPSPEPSGIPSDWSKEPEIQPRVWASGSWESTELSQLGLGLIILLLALIVVGLLVAKQVPVGDSALVAKPPVEQAVTWQPASWLKLRLRRHGFGQ